LDRSRYCMTKKKNSLFLAIVVLIFSRYAFTDLRAENLYTVLKKSPNIVFVESGGTAAGKAISWAWEAGCQEIYMIDSNRF
jgi:hypothetical protein